MNQKLWNRSALPAAAGLLLLLSACEYKAPASPWEQARNADRVLPVITAVEPAEAGAASEITLIGDHFGETASLNTVYFDGTPAVIKSASVNRITVLRPNVIGDSVRISVVVDGAVGIARHAPYKMVPVVETFGFFANLDAFLACAADAEEKLTVAMGSTSFIRLNPDGTQDLGFSKTSATALWTDLAVGPDGMVYAARANNILYRLQDDTSVVQTVITLASRNDRVKSMDFSADGTIYGGGKNSDLIIIRSPTDAVKSGFYATWDIFCVRVYGNRVYVAAKFTGNGTVPVPAGVWRHAIQGDGTLAEGELVCDWAQGPAPDAVMAALALSENGVLYIGNNHPDVPVVTFDTATGSWNTLFYGIIPSPVDQMSWGPGRYLYAVVNRTKNMGNGGRLLRIDMGVLEAQ
ncbi:IPT/TIG domain-containing protein [bacterium]|nr:IPT/TIG domain-containing protein [bacterium]